MKLTDRFQKRSVKNNDCENNEIAKQCWKQITTLAKIRKKL